MKVVMVFHVFKFWSPYGMRYPLFSHVLFLWKIFFQFYKSKTSVTASSTTQSHASWSEIMKIILGPFLKFCLQELIYDTGRCCINQLPEFVCWLFSINGCRSVEYFYRLVFMQHTVVWLWFVKLQLCSSQFPCERQECWSQKK